MAEPKTYLNGIIIKEHAFPNGDTMLKASVKVDEVCEFLRSHADENGWVRLDITKRLKPSDKGITHSVTLNTWRPRDTSGVPFAARGKYPADRPAFACNGEQAAPTPAETTDNLPF